MSSIGFDIALDTNLERAYATKPIMDTLAAEEKKRPPTPRQDEFHETLTAPHGPPAFYLTTKEPEATRRGGDTDFTDDHGFSANPSVKIREIWVPPGVPSSSSFVSLRGLTRKPK